MGWNALREQIFANQKRLGVIPAEHRSSRRGRTICRSGTRSHADEKKLFARQAEVFAAYAAYTDHEIGRVIQAVEDLGKLDNTLIIYIERRQRHERGRLDDRHALRYGRDPGHQRAGRGAAEVLRRLGLGGRPRRTCRWRGPGRSTRRSSGPSRSPRISAARARAWPSPGRTASRMRAASAPSSTT